ncbi:MAG: LON peptidase substrate-binding domain-containing protein [Verrucomicrobia bacterium]|nr:LON peptidase substrate-binding domain-containing protein [Verrucomicrobiota bacterium]
MQLPSEVPVMTLPNATLFPQAMLPLYVFEPRYRKMLADALHSHRMFIVAMQKPGRIRETPSAVAGLGLIRASVSNRDGTSHLILQGLARVELTKTVRYKPYRIQRIRPLTTTGRDSVAVDALAAKVLELVAERLEQGLELPVHVLNQLRQIEDDQEDGTSPVFSLKQVIKYLVRLQDPDQLADLVSCTLLPRPLDRQTILESVNLENRLKHLVHFLLAEIRRHKRKDSPEP